MNSGGVRSPGDFSILGPRSAAAAAILMVLLVVSAGWVNGPEELRSAEHLTMAMVKLGVVIAAAGWGVAGVAISLVAIAITAVTIIGLRDPDQESERRRSLVMSLADIFMIGAHGLLMGCIVSSIVGLFGLTWQSREEGVFSGGIDLWALLAIAIVLWSCVGSEIGRASCRERVF